jgi:hypothetical protein
MGLDSFMGSAHKANNPILKRGPLFFKKMGDGLWFCHFVKK